jgi:hypothetical protein
MATIPQINYGIPAMDYGPLTESLANLGRGVGMALTMKAQQKQASEALPALQESYKNAFGKISRGEIADGYSDLLSASMNPAVAQNPFLSQYASQADQLARSAANAVIQQGFQRGGGGGGGTVTPQASLLPAFEGEDMGVDFNEQIVEVPLPPQGKAPSAIAVPPTGEEQMPPVMAGQQPSAQPKATPQQVAAIGAQKKYFSLSPKEQEKMDEETTYNMDELKDNFDVAPVAGLGRFIPGAIGIAVPKPTVRKEKTFTQTSEGRQTLKIDKKVAEEATSKGKEAASNLAKYVSTLESNPDAMGLISRSGGISKIITQRDGDTYTLKQVGSKDELEVDADTFAAVNVIKGARAVGAASGIPVVVGRYDFGTVEEAEAANLPSGTIVYINGRKARID